MFVRRQRCIAWWRVREEEREGVLGCRLAVFCLRSYISASLEYLLAKLQRKWAVISAVPRDEVNKTRSARASGTSTSNASTALPLPHHDGSSDSISRDPTSSSRTPATHSGGRRLEWLRQRLPPPLL